MVVRIYIIILLYFLAGAISFFFINRHKTNEEAKKNRIKLLSYFIIINTLYFSICINTFVFRYLSVIILLTGLYEIINLFVKSGYMKKSVLLTSIAIYSALAYGFFWFSALTKEKILFVFLVISAFDSFSQISGQIAGRHKLCPGISPAKTYEGLAGGIIFAFITAFLIRGLLITSIINIIVITLIIVISALGGDLMASLLKRRYRVKDFSNLLPGQGGFLDRFDSLIAGGAVIFLFSKIMQQI